MRRLVVVAAAIVLFGCDLSPSIEKVAADSKDRLQDQLDHDFADKHLTVQKVDVVKLSAPKYEGMATIAANGTTFTVPVTVTSDGKTTIVATDDQKLSAYIQSSLQHRLSILEGKYSDYVVSLGIFDLFPASLKAARADFVARLEVVQPVASNGDFYFGSGCKAHECGTNEAAWVVDRNTGAATAVIMKQIPNIPGVMAAHMNFQLYGATANNLPAPLAAWAGERGMTEMNVVADVQEYRAPSK